MRVVVCDDHPVFRDGLRLLLQELGHEVVADVGTGEEAVTVAADLRPDLVVMDLRLPGLSGLAATRAVVAQGTARVLVLTMLDDDAALVAALRAGASGFLLKGAGAREVESAVTAAARGELVLDAGSTDRLRASLGRVAPSLPGLGARDLEVLTLVARGQGNEQIAAALGLSPKTVRNRVSALATRLDAASRAELVAIARDRGIGQPEP